MTMNDEEDIELPILPPAIPGPDCPFCGEPTVSIDGDFICLDCNGASYGPETG